MVASPVPSSQAELDSEEGTLVECELLVRRYDLVLMKEANYCGGDSELLSYESPYFTSALCAFGYHDLPVWPADE